MRANLESITRQVERYGPARPLPEIVQELNRLYHAAEARDYDAKHTEIFKQLPAQWAELIPAALAAAPNRPLRVLDFGSGTGFEARQLLARLGSDRVAGLACYDLSPEMLEQCRKNVAPIFPGARFTADWGLVQSESDHPFDLLLTNSLLHHLPDIDETLGRIRGVLSAKAVWIAGHEPSSRYYRNPQCLAALATFRRERQWRRYFAAQNYWNRAKAAVGMRSSPAEVAAERAYEEKLFARRPPTSLVTQLVDFHVPHDAGEAAAGRGLDFEALAAQWAGRWRLLHVRTYSFMGPFYEQRLPQKWRQTCRKLAEEFPRDGANFGAVWLREQ